MSGIQWQDIPQRLSGVASGLLVGSVAMYVILPSPMATALLSLGVLVAFVVGRIAVDDARLNRDRRVRRAQIREQVEAYIQERERRFDLYKAEVESMVGFPIYGGTDKQKREGAR